MFTCKVCGKQFDSTIYKAQEVRFGWGDEFDYIHCPHCNSVYIKEVPSDLSRFYSSEYYSLKQDEAKEKESFIRRIMRYYLLKYRIDGKNLIGNFISLKEKEAFQWIEPGLMNFNSSVMDIGCGTGRTILKLANSGFTNVQGIDPYLENDIVHNIKNQKVHIWKKEASEVHEKYDIITLTNVMEHLPNPHDAFESFSNMMHDKSTLIMYLPVMSNFTWEHYGIKQHQLWDAPRHLFIYSIDALRQVAAAHGLELTKCKSHFYYRILADVHDNISSEIQKMNKKQLENQLVKKNDAGHAFLYFKLAKK